MKVLVANLHLTKAQLNTWILKNWTTEGEPFSSGGADVTFIDNPQVPGLSLTKKVKPELPIVYRSHIKIHSDLVQQKSFLQDCVWQYLQKNIQLINFSSLAMSPHEKLALLGAATNRLDGLNKHLSPWDSHYCMGKFHSLCTKCELKWPIARFDPPKGIPNVIDFYSQFHKLLKDVDKTKEKMPLLLM
ncbi:hypothetical protein J3R83DRAFT_8797 [Lanmaoa asiatica]|nr:hypothetical protein J3R83DRAFT_8797 [Lanmaoa asiatica]